jgi:signal transduction histidine kinase
MMVVPLAARDSVLGVLTFLVVDSGRRFTSGALATARDLAVHAATAIENARLYESAQRAIRARDDVLTFVSHDLRSPLTGIYLTTEMLLRGAQGNERRKGWAQLERVRRSTQQMQRMIDDLLDLASVEAGRLNIDVGGHAARRLCEDALAMLAPAATEKGVKLHLDIRHDGLVTCCDRGRVVQVLSNLLGNAVKFTPADGKVTLTLEQIGDRAQFTVLDTGPGVPAGLREHIFERFWQAEETARKGRGLGLYIAKGLVEAQGGTMWMASPAQGGASFSFTLPLVPAKDEQRAKRTQSATTREQRGPRRRPRAAARPG